MKSGDGRRGYCPCLQRQQRTLHHQTPRGPWQRGVSSVIGWMPSLMRIRRRRARRRRKNSGFGGLSGSETQSGRGRPRVCPAGTPFAPSSFLRRKRRRRGSTERPKRKRNPGAGASGAENCAADNGPSDTAERPLPHETQSGPGRPRVCALRRRTTACPPRGKAAEKTTRGTGRRDALNRDRGNRPAGNCPERDLFPLFAVLLRIRRGRRGVLQAFPEPF